ncbi:MAG TPA: hypothetical protein VLS91_07065, partial [Acidimicrobiales bacterium]|nr:hypothetical protein [Acidimicrobiales bacterium]
MALRLEHVAQATGEVRTLWNELVDGSNGVRGASAIFEDLGDIDDVIERGCLWLGRDVEPVSLAVLEGGIVKILYVASGHRRRGLGR